MKIKLEKEDKTKLWKNLAMFLSILCLMICLQPTQKAMAKQASSGRLKVEESDMYINERTIFDVTYRNRTKDEEISITVKDPDMVTVKAGKWYEDSKTVIVIPKKNGVTTLVVKAGQDEITITLHISSRTKLSTQELYETCSKSMVEIASNDSVGNQTIGSGFFINSNQIVTNYHVIDCANQIYVYDYNGKSYEVVAISGYNSGYDLAVLEVKESTSSALILNQKKLKAGMSVYTIGSPLKLTGSMSEGILSYANREYEGLICQQHTADISKKSGGGPLLNEYGEVIGVNLLMILQAQDIYLSVDINYLDALKTENEILIDEFYKSNEEKIKSDPIYISLP